MVAGEATTQYLISQPNNILPEKEPLVNRSFRRLSQNELDGALYYRFKIEWVFVAKAGDCFQLTRYIMLVQQHG